MNSSSPLGSVWRVNNVSFQNMAVVAGQDGKEDTTQEDELREEIESFSQNRASTRKGGKQLPSMPKGRVCNYPTAYLVS